MRSDRLIDLHLHTLASEGLLSLENQFAYAVGRGLSAIAVTDRDVLPDTAEAARLARQYGLACIPGTEITAGYKGEEIHILGYQIDPASAALVKTVRRIQEARMAHVQIMVYKLNQQGIRIQLEDVKRQALSPPYLGRLHIARALVERGYIGALRDAFSDKLIGIDGDCYYPTSLVPAVEIISTIREGGGIPVLAHPGVYHRRLGLSIEELEELREAGLKGIEAYHPCHSGAVADAFAGLGRNMNLLVTGGSGCRGVNYDPILRSQVDVPDHCLPELEAAGLISVQNNLSLGTRQ